MTGLVEITLEVPQERESCTLWIKEQTPETVASVLELSACAWHCLQTTADSDLGEKHAIALEEQRTKRKRAEELLESERREHDNVLRKRLCLEKEKTTEAITQREKEHEQVLQALEAKRATERTHFNKRIEEVEAEVAADVKKRYDRQISALENDNSKNEEELRHQKGKEAIVRTEIAQQYEQQRAHEVQGHENTISSLNQAHQREMAALNQRLEDAKANEKYFKTQCEQRSAELKETEETNKRILSECNSRLESVLSRKNATSIGKAGEDTVEHIFSTMCLGNWCNESGKALEGFGDALWTYSSPQSNCVLQCLVEVKNVASLHSEHDIGKWKRDIVTGAKNGRINAGMLISLGAHISGTRQIDLTYLEGVPVMRASRASDDPMPISSLVRVAFYCFSQIWPALCRQRVDTADTTITAVCNYLDGQAENFSKLSKIIDSLEKNTIQIQRQIVALKKSRDALVSANDCLRLNNPQLALQQSIEEELKTSQDPWLSETGQEVLTAIKDWRVSKGGGRRYPKTHADLTLSDEAKSFMQRIPNSFVVATKLVKDSFQVKKKLKTEES